MKMLRNFCLTAEALAARREGGLRPDERRLLSRSGNRGAL